MKKNLLIVFAKNKLFGKVKTRLAKTVGDDWAYKVYECLYAITAKESCAVQTAHVQVHYSHYIDEEAWGENEKYIQKGADLGARMQHAFKQGFDQGFSNIIGIGADLPEITAALIEKAFVQLEDKDFVFGPAEDGGYYLVGMRKEEGAYIFKNKPWSTPALFEITQQEIIANQHTLSILEMHNDIDTIADLEKSSIANQFSELLNAKLK